MPTASATTFFTAPPSSIPMTSSFVYGRNHGVTHDVATRSAVASSTQATTLAAGWRSAISRARFGPETTTIRWASTWPTSAMTSLIRLVVPSSTPFISETTAASAGSSGAQPSRLPRRVCDGTARTTTSAPSRASAASTVAAHPLRQLDARQVRRVAAGVDLVDHLLPTAPHDDARPRVGHRRREGGAPASGAEDGGSRAHRLPFLKFPVSGSPDRLGSWRIAGAVPPRMPSNRSVICTMIRSVAILRVGVSSGRS